MLATASSAGGPAGAALSLAASAGEVRERALAVVIGGEVREESFLVGAGVLCPGDRVPRDALCAGVRELPDQASASMPDGLAGSEPAELLQPPVGEVGLPDVDDVSAGHPVADERIVRDARVLTLEASAWVGLQEGRHRVAVAVHDVAAGEWGTRR